MRAFKILNALTFYSLVINFTLPRYLGTSPINPLMTNIPSKFNRTFPTRETRGRPGQNPKVIEHPLSLVNDLSERFLLHKIWIGYLVLFWVIFCYLLSASVK